MPDKRLTSAPTPAFLRAKPLIRMMALGEGLALIVALALNLNDSWRFFAIVSLAIQLTLLCTLVQLTLLHYRLPQLSAPRLANLAFGLFVLNVVLVWICAGFVFAPTVALSLGEWLALLLRLGAIVIVCSGLALVMFHYQWQTRMLSLRLKQAELDALRARVDPHFLFNSLNTAVALVHTQPDDAEQVLLDLSDLFRTALSGNELHPLKRELELTRRYLEIEKLRLGERLRVEWQLPEHLPSRNIPALTLQTLVENAVRHGIEKMPGGGKVLISAQMDARNLRLKVSNPIPQRSDRPGVSGHKVGIAATRARLAAASEGQGGLLTFMENGEYISEIVLPLRAA